PSSVGSNRRSARPHARGAPWVLPAWTLIRGRSGSNCPGRQITYFGNSQDWPPPGRAGRAVSGYKCRGFGRGLTTVLTTDAPRHGGKLQLARTCGAPRPWARRDSNPHTLRYQILSLARLPVPPPARRQVVNQQM